MVKFKSKNQLKQGHQFIQQSYNWKLEEKPDTLEEILEESAEFQNYIGDILADLIQESAKVKNAGKHTDNNTEDLDTE